MSYWIDTHCHLDAQEFGHDLAEVCARARSAGVVHCVIPAVAVSNFTRVRELAHAYGFSYALGIHPLCVKQAQDEDLLQLDRELSCYANDPRLVAVGEIGLDFFVPELCASPLRERQEHFYGAQLNLARKHDLAVILHVRRSADRVLRGLRARAAQGLAWHGIAHAFAGSAQQADAFLRLGLKLGFGGAVTFERALQLRRLAASLPLSALVTETDAPDIPPHWIYRTAAERAGGQPQGRNEPAELARIALTIAFLRGIAPEQMAQASLENACAALPKLRALLV
ncbi:MAG: TatD family hydrolase [Burkholderiaceae bacterium]